VSPHTAYGDETSWYAGYGGLVQYWLTTDEAGAYRFESYPDAVRAREALLSSQVAAEAAVEELRADRAAPASGLARSTGISSVHTNTLVGLPQMERVPPLNGSLG
jgi:hypothetical protein